MTVQVQCYSGRKADERPIRVGIGDHVFMVEDVVKQWYGPEDTFFRVRADDGNVYLLRLERATSAWSMEWPQNAR